MTEDLAPYYPPVSPRLFPVLFAVLLGCGMVAAAYVFVYQATQKRKNVLWELMVAFIGAMCLGFGTLFLFLWGGLWV